MSVGSVNPLEWLFPPLAITHAAVDTAAQATTGKPAVVTPGSAVDKQRKAENEQSRRIQEAQKLSESRAAAEPKPLTAAEEFESRRRALSASEFLTGQRRATSTLTAQGTLG